MIYALCLTFGIMFIPAWLIASFAGMNGMALCFILFYAVNPVYSVGLGVWSGMDIKEMWSMPMFSAMIYLLSMWMLFDVGELAFVWYAIGYLLLGLLAMGITALIIKHRK